MEFEKDAEELNNVEITSTVEKDDQEKADDPYSYLERGDFSSEMFKLELSNLPKKFGIAQLKKKLLHLKLKPCKVKSVDQGHYAFVTFRNEEDKTEAVKVLQGYIWKNKPIRVKSAAANADPLLLKRKLETENEDRGDEKRLKFEEGGVHLNEKLNDIVTPLWKTPYEEQIEIKSKAITSCLKKLTKEICNNNQDHSFVMAGKKQKYGGLCCLFHPVKASPITSEYRNKCEFTIGKDNEGNDRVVGFRIGSYKDGDLTVVPADECINIPASMKDVLHEVQGYLDSRQGHPSFNPCTRKGFWKHVLIRISSVNAQVLLNLVCHPQQLNDEEMESERQLFREYYGKLFADKSTGVTSLYFQFESDRKERFEEGTPVHLLGDKFIMENLLNMRFQISPLSFFQVNTQGAEVLYSVIADMCKVNSNTILIDTCCGTGTIGLTMAQKVKKVVGIEVNSQAMCDAKINAELNGVENVEFICGKVEDVLPGILKDLDEEEVVVVMDPPRAGLHSDVVRAVRRATFVSRLVYVSCKLPAALQNIVDFTRQTSRRVIGKPFQLMEVLAVDLFPHTELYETVLLLERQACNV